MAMLTSYTNEGWHKEWTSIMFIWYKKTVIGDGSHIAESFCFNFSISKGITINEILTWKRAVNNVYGIGARVVSKISFLYFLSLSW